MICWKVGSSIEPAMLHDAMALLEERNDQLQRATDDLAVRPTRCASAHQELQAAHEELKRAETQLVQSERLTSLGQVVAGVAHEINNPLAFVTNNVALIAARRQPPS